jgi:hypothetical protein
MEDGRKGMDNFPARGFQEKQKPEYFPAFRKQKVVPGP